MPFVRNPFKKTDENTRPIIIDGVVRSNSDSKSAEVAEIEKAEYKLSDINDSGICLPPSPVERKTSFWGHTNSSRSTTSSNHRSLVNDSEQFNISRESFDSYRRSFDISGRSPIIRPNEFAGRASLDSRSYASPIRPQTSRPAPIPIVPPVTREEDFEDVGLDEYKPPQAKKRGLFARLTESNDNPTANADGRPTSSHEKSSWHHFGSRKRGQSGQGAELGSYPNELKRDDTPKPSESGLKTPTKPAEPATVAAA